MFWLRVFANNQWSPWRLHKQRLWSTAEATVLVGSRAARADWPHKLWELAWCYSVTAGATYVRVFRCSCSCGRGERFAGDLVWGVWLSRRDLRFFSELQRRKLVDLRTHVELEHALRMRRSSGGSQYLLIQLVSSVTSLLFQTEGIGVFSKEDSSEREAASLELIGRSTLLIEKQYIYFYCLFLRSIELGCINNYN